MHRYIQLESKFFIRDTHYPYPYPCIFLFLLTEHCGKYCQTSIIRPWVTVKKSGIQNAGC